MRVFVAIPIPPDVQIQLKNLVHNLASRLPLDSPINWVKPENFHITLKFIGECPEERIPLLNEALNGIAQVARRFPVGFGGLGCFEQKGPLRAIWIGLNQGVGELTALAHGINQACEPLGFPLEKRPFQPHLTLARVKDVSQPRVIRAAVEHLNTPEMSSFTAESLSLVRSILSPAGPTYTPLHRAQLN